MRSQQVRFVELDAARADATQRTVPVVVATEYPVARGSYREVLLQQPENVDLSRAPLPLIESHDSGTLNIGLIEELHATGSVLRGVARFGSSARAEEVWQDVQNGIVRNVSVGYTIDAYEVDDDTVRATRWTPLEVSLVAVPADPSAGLNRAHRVPIGRITMNAFPEGQPAADAAHLSRAQRRALNAPAPIDVNQVRREARENEAARVRDILDMGKQFAALGGIALADECIRKSVTVDGFRQAMLARIAEKPMPSPNLGIGLEDEREHFSLIRAIASQIEPRIDADFERTWSDQVAQRLGRKPRGVYVPLGELSTRAVTVAGAPALVGTEHMGASFIDALRARSVIMGLGATTLTGLTADVSIPRLSTSATSYWIAGDGSDGLTESTPAFDAVTLTPKTVGALVRLSRKTILQANPTAEDLVRNDLAQVIANAIDAAAIQGTGANNQPVGVAHTAGIASDSFAGSAPTFAEIVAMESALTGASVDLASAAYLTTPALAGSMKTTPITDATNGTMIWQAGRQPGVGVVNGLRAYFTSNVPAGQVILGNWADLLVGFWGAVDVEVNPYDDFAKGIVSVRCFASVDFGVRHPQSFAVYSTT